VERALEARDQRLERLAERERHVPPWNARTVRPLSSWRTWRVPA
jgi:hypothetical protein